jgi:hypothetical protein
MHKQFLTARDLSPALGADRDPGCNYLTREQISEMRGLGQARSTSGLLKVGLFAGAMVLGIYFLLSE